MSKRSFRVGITGKMGSGKSVLSKVFRDLGITILDADTIAKDVMQGDDRVRQEITSILGSKSYNNGTLDTAFVAEKIFSDESLKEKVEKAVHPATLEYILHEFDKAKPGEIVGLESAIIFQTGLDEIFDAVVLVDSKDEQILDRLAAGGKFSSVDIQKRLASQFYEDEMKQDADLVITNDSTLREFESRCKRALEILRISAMQELPDTPLRNHFDGSVSKSGS
jgi:dephospho-CoA kinase